MQEGYYDDVEEVSKITMKLYPESFIKKPKEKKKIHPKLKEIMIK